jgi:hypothetical protein
MSKRKATGANHAPPTRWDELTGARALVELKAMAYDRIALLEQVQRELAEINQRIQNLQTAPRMPDGSADGGVT